MEGKNEITLSLEGYRVFTKVYSSSYYLGEARKGESPATNDIAARLQISTDQNDLLGSFLQVAVERLNKMLTRYMGDTSCRKESDTAHTGYALYTFTIKGPSNFMSSQAERLAMCLENYAAAKLLYEWLKINKPDEAVIAEAGVTEQAALLREITASRKKPQ